LFMRTKKECLHAAAEIGYPVVIKIVSPEVIHKSEVGGVILELRTPQELEEGYERLQKNVREKAGDPPISGILVQQSMAGGVEVAVGGANNAQFGPVGGREACDLEAICQVMVNTGRLLTDIPQIEEIDFNPVQAFPGGCFVLDARIKLKNQTPEGRR
jgi:acetate---CoA ligase (ADP-forming) subunit beta